VPFKTLWGGSPVPWMVMAEVTLNLRQPRALLEQQLGSTQHALDFLNQHQVPTSATITLRNWFSKYAFTL